MDSFLIRGGTPLRGTIDVSGSKNSALPILAATLLADGPTTLHGVPRLTDVEVMCRLLGELGCRVQRREPGGLNGRDVVDFSGRPTLNGPLEVEYDPARATASVRYDLAKEMRASICLLGPILARHRSVRLALPGGCTIGDRPVGLHLKGLKKLGATFHLDGGNIVGEVPGGRLKGTRMFLGGPKGPTVLGTINVMCAAALAEGTTVIVGAACEPEVADCAAMLNRMGARIMGVGGPELVIVGVDKLEGVSHTVIPDRIEAGTFIMAAAATGGDLLLRNANAEHLLAVLDILSEVNVDAVAVPEGIRVVSKGVRGSTEVTTQPYPGFPTDLQAQLMAMLCLGDDVSVITERIFDDRFKHVAELSRMGAKIVKEGQVSVVCGRGMNGLRGAPVTCSDLRASAALVIAGLAASGTTRLDQVYHIDRGYEKIEHKLRAVGADIVRVDEQQAARHAAA